MKRVNLFLFLCFLSLSVLAQYKGVVFVDANYNHKYDKGERTLKDVKVSDGLHVVKTDAKGRYSLEGYDETRFIFITTPSGYKTNNAYYLPIKAGRKEYNFGLITHKASLTSTGEHRFIHISDTEIGYPQEHHDWVQNLREYTQYNPVDFIIHTGDICYETGLKSHIKLMNTANMSTPIFYCIGNHDLVKGKYGEALFERLYGPTWYSFEVGNVHYIVTPMLHGDYKPSYTADQVYAWVENDLAQIPRDMPIVVFNHDLLSWGDSFVLKSKHHKIDLDAHNLKAYIYGHWHINHIHKHKKAVSVCTSTLVRGGIDHATSAFRIFNVDRRGNFTSELRYSYINKSICINSIDNEKSVFPRKNKITFSVNTYSTVSPVKKVTYTCTYENKIIIKEKKLKQQTDFNWRGEFEIPKKWLGKYITVIASAEFENGEIARTTRSFYYIQSTITALKSSKNWSNLLSNPAHYAPQDISLRLPLELAWVNNVGSNIYMASPLIYKDNVYVGSIDENAQGKASISCYDLSTGMKRWMFPVKASIRNSIAASNNRIFAQDVEGVLYALNAATGKLLWSYQLPAPTLPAMNDGLIATEKTLFAGTGQALCAFNVIDGTLLWKNKSWKEDQGCTATLSLGSNVLIGNAHWGSLYANDATTGKLLWSNSKFGLRNRSASSVIIGENLYLISKNSFFIIDIHTGRVITRKVLGYNVDVTSSPLVTDKEIIFGTSERGVVALDRETLEEKWNYKTRPSMIYTSPYVRNPLSTVETSPVLCGQNVFVGASDGFLYALDKSTGRLKWSYDVGAPIFTTVAVSGNILCVADYAGNVYLFASH